MRAQSMVLTDRILLYYQGVLSLVIPSCHKPFLKHLAIPRHENLCVEPFHSQSQKRKPREKSTSRLLDLEQEHELLL